jgi:uncharacterized protein
MTTDQPHPDDSTSGPDSELAAALSAPPSEQAIPEPKLPIWRSVYVWAVYLLLLGVWPVTTFLSSPRNLDEMALALSVQRLMVYLNTGLVLWLMFFLVWSAQRMAHRPLRAIGFARLRLTDPFIALGFLIGANLFLNALAWILKQVGLEVPDVAVRALLPATGWERVAWVALSISAGICEESCFRGFLLTQGRNLIPSWTPLVIASSIAFGVGHLYQGAAGGIMIAIYGVLFCLLRLWRGSLWPGIWAHVWQDVAGMALGKWAGY